MLSNKNRIMNDKVDAELLVLKSYVGLGLVSWSLISWGLVSRGWLLVLLSGSNGDEGGEDEELSMELP